MKRVIFAILFGYFALAAAACVGTTGGELVAFPAAASGPQDAIGGQPMSFETSRGWHVELTTASMHVGALYLSDNLESSGSQLKSCILPTTSYVAQVIEGRDIDLLTNQAQPFPVLGHGTTLQANAAQVWLTGGDVDDASDPPTPTVVLHLVGSANNASNTRHFEAKLTIASNRLTPDSALPGADPICLERIVSPIPTTVTIRDQGALLLRIDPRLLFTNLDFSTLSTQTDDGTFEFTDASNAPDQASVNLFNNLVQAGPLYAFSWVPALD